MAVFDVTGIVLSISDVMPWDRSGHRQRNMWELVHWLSDNVGEYYGRGNEETCTVRVGLGWEIFALYNNKREQPSPDHDCTVSWCVDITDEAKATLFALKWIR